MTDWTSQLINGAPQRRQSPIGGPDWASQLMNPQTVETMDAGARPRPVRDDNAGAASIRATGSASLLPDIADQITAYSRSMGIPENRFGVVDGNIIYADEHGNYTRVNPSVSGGQGIGDTAQRAARYLASGIGPAISMAGGMAGGAVGGPLTSVIGAGVGGALADAGRQALGRSLAGLDPVEINPLNVVGQGALAATGQAAGNVASHLFTRNPLGVGTYDRLTATDPANMGQWGQLASQATRAGVPLDIAQVTGLPSLRAASRQLRRFPETTDRMTEFYTQQQSRDVPAAFRRTADTVAGRARPLDEAVGANPEFPGVDPTGRALPRPGMRGAAQDIIDDASRARTAAASPHYQEAFGSGTVPDIGPVMQQLDGLIASGRFPENSATARALNAARTSLTREVPNPNGQGTMRVPTDNYEGMHNAKLAMDSALGELSRSGASRADIRAAERQLLQVQRDLTQRLRAAHPGYERGYQAYIANSPAVQAAERDLGALAQMGGAERMQVLDAVFRPTGTTPERIARMRQAFLMNGRIDEWNAGLRSFMENTLDNAMRPLREGGEVGNVAGALYQTIMEPRQWRIIEAALPRTEAANLRALMGVLQAASRIAPLGSQTATDMASAAAVGAERIGGGIRTAGQMMSPGNLALRLPEMIGEQIAAARTPAARIQFAERFTDPQALRTLGNLRLMNPRSEQAMRLALRFLTTAGVPAAGEAIMPEPDREPASALPRR